MSRTRLLRHLQVTLRFSASRCPIDPTMAEEERCRRLLAPDGAILHVVYYRPEEYKIFVRVILW